MKLSLTGKNAIVTGGSKGIGKAITVALAEAGARTYFTYHGSEEKAELICKKPSILNKVRSFKVDVSKEVEIINLFKELDDHPSIEHIMVHTGQHFDKLLQLDTLFAITQWLRLEPQYTKKKK